MIYKKKKIGPNWEKINTINFIEKYLIHKIMKKLLSDFKKWLKECSIPILYKDGIFKKLLMNFNKFKTCIKN